MYYKTIIKNLKAIKWNYNKIWKLLNIDKLDTLTHVSKSKENMTQKEVKN